MEKTITIKEYRTLPIHAEANMKHGKQVVYGGAVWEWLRGGKRITLKRVGSL